VLGAEESSHSSLSVSAVSLCLMTHVSPAATADGDAILKVQSLAQFLFMFFNIKPSASVCASRPLAARGGVCEIPVCESVVLDSSRITKLIVVKL
jgi:hypothetical protein